MSITNVWSGSVEICTILNIVIVVKSTGYVIKIPSSVAVNEKLEIVRE